MYRMLITSNETFLSLILYDNELDFYESTFKIDEHAHCHDFCILGSTL